MTDLKPDPTDDEISEAFHKLWTWAVGRDGYSKKDWMALQNLLRQRGIVA